MTQIPQQDRANPDRVKTENLRDLSGLRRSLTDRKVAGVAGGLGRHLNVDPTIIRVLFVVLCFFGGAGFLLYGAAWLLVPEEGKEEAIISAGASARNALLVAAAVVAGLFLIGDSWGGFGFPWPLAVVALVIFVVLMNRDRPMTSQNPPNSAGPGGVGVTGGADTTPDTTPSDTTTLPPGEPQSPTPPWAPPTQQGYEPPPPQPDRGPKLFWVTVAIAAIALGSLGLYDVAGGSVVDAAYPALALTVVGIMLVLGAWFGRAGGLIFLGIVAVLALAAASVTTPRWEGDRWIEATPTKAIQVEDRYSVPAGSIHLDMSNIRDIERLDGQRIDLEANAGELVVTLPEGVDAHVVADLAVAGEANVAGEIRNGTNVHIERDIDGGANAPEITVNLDLVVGDIEVRQP